MTQPILNINPKSKKTKFLQIVDSVLEAIARGQLNVGDALPSVNQIINEFGLSRDTVFKAYTELKKRGVVVSVQNKGYYVASDTKKVFLLLDTMKAYKEVLYGEFNKSLPGNYSHTVQFHHYDLDAFRGFVQEAVGKYSKYIIMPFDQLEIKDILLTIPKEKLLILDWKVNEDKDANVLYQDFGEAFYDSIEKAINQIRRYNEIVFLYPEFTYHPHDTVEYFKKFCKDYNLKHSILYNSDELDIQKGKVYVSVADRMLARSLEQAEDKNIILGKDAGLISYNETPMKKFVNNGITVISTNFKLLGRKAAEFVTQNERMDFCVPTTLIMRNSL